jgi:hypothetical protein
LNSYRHILKLIFQKEANRLFLSDSSVTSEDSDSEARRNGAHVKKLGESKKQSPRKPSKSNRRGRSAKAEPTTEEKDRPSTSKEGSSPVTSKKRSGKRMGARCCKIKPVQKVPKSREMYRK